jgi:hypothetical protein
MAFSTWPIVFWTFPGVLEKENNMAAPRAVRYTDIVPAKNTVIGSKVVNAPNEDLGKIEDRIRDAGRIAYARVPLQLVGKAPS